MNKNKTQGKLTSGPVGKTLIKLTIPMIFGMIGMVAFNLTDTYFVGKLGTNHLAALSFTFPVVFIINSIALGLGMGASAVISRAIGEGDQHRVKRLTTDSLLLAFSIVIGFVIFGLLTIEPLFTLLGAKGQILDYIKQYMMIWYIGMPFVVVPMVGNNAIRATGDTKTPSLIMMIAAGMNMLLDPLLIFGIGPFPELGIEGAALATVFSRFTTFTVALWVLAKREKMLTSHFDSFRQIIQSWQTVLFIGIPIMAARMMIPLTTGIITKLLADFGPKSVAGYGVASRVEFFAMAVIMSLASVFGPFIGQNLGAKNITRILKSIKFSSRFAILWGILLFILLRTFATSIGRIFNEDKEVVSTIVLYLSIVPISYGLNGIFQLFNTALNVIKRPYHAAGLIFLQMFVIYIPLANLGAKYWQEKGIFLATMTAYILGGILSYFVLKFQLRKIITIHEDADKNV
ncbi:MAG: MATE family efflux transporter [Candidatus Cloacimonetes bacterium]|nr:MATE family efflux transporter [Candidatus Cloacimonadota bacterium]MCF7814932.1 MATE family efflux transporter [Candidatus Cloacimonadota bacterium]MCF7868142.1 MATE family efflux transporter [Candidatus Cloacimonadota bacterium]MCF7883608.1 MATE family efflux transporter [Candidatus Cloacimonadota bacterium]